MFNCAWYVDESLEPELKTIIQNMSETLKNKIHIEILNGKTLFKRFVRSFSCDILHVFGNNKDSFSVKANSNVIYTLFNDDDLPKKHISRFFLSDAKDSEEIISPFFGSLSTDSKEHEKCIISNGNLKVEGFEFENISGKFSRPEALSGIYVTLDNNQLEALRAGFLTIRGLTIASKKSKYLDEIIGSENYFLIENEDDVKKIINHAFTDKGRFLATSARHFLNENHSEKKCAKNLLSLYEKIMQQL